VVQEKVVDERATCTWFRQKRLGTKAVLRLLPAREDMTNRRRVRKCAEEI
jgi:hypothetical protein